MLHVFQVATSGISQYVHMRRPCGAQTWNAVFDHQAVLRLNSFALGDVQKQIRRRFASLDLGSRIDVIGKAMLEADNLQRSCCPFRAAARRNTGWYRQAVENGLKSIRRR